MQTDVSDSISNLANNILKCCPKIAQSVLYSYFQSSGKQFFFLSATHLKAKIGRLREVRHHISKIRQWDSIHIGTCYNGYDMYA